MFVSILIFILLIVSYILDINTILLSIYTFIDKEFVKEIINLISDYKIYLIVFDIFSIITFLMLTIKNLIDMACSGEFPRGRREKIIKNVFNFSIKTIFAIISTGILISLIKGNILLNILIICLIVILLIILSLNFFNIIYFIRDKIHGL